MSTKSPNAISGGDNVEVRLTGPGTATINLFDGSGRSWASTRLTVTGHQSVECRTKLPLRLTTQDRPVDVVAVLIHQTDGRQRVTFSGQEHAAATAKRFAELKLKRTAIEKIHHIAESLAETAPHSPMMLSLGGSGPRPR
jgi:hypothetical protein